jgi:ABC-type transporter Mla subunit MlaD
VRHGCDLLCEHFSVANDELLRKIDRTLERNTEAYERNRDAFERNREAFERTMATLDRVNDRLDRDEERDRDFRRYLDGLTERHVGITQQLIETMNSGFAQLQAEISSASAKLQAEIADQREQIQANTQAVLRVLDRLGPSPQQG